MRSDDIALEVRVGPGAALELVELGAMLAHSTRGGPHCRITASVEIADGGSLIWMSRPLIVSPGAAVIALLTVSLGPDARMLRGESIRLGRDRDEPGELRSRQRIVLAGLPLLDETLDTRPLDVLRSPVVAGDAPMLGAVTLAGCRDEDPPPGAMACHGPATLWRATGDAVSVERTAAAVAERWRPLAGSRYVAS